MSKLPFSFEFRLDVLAWAGVRHNVVSHTNDACWGQRVTGCVNSLSRDYRRSDDAACDSLRVGGE